MTASSRIQLAAKGPTFSRTIPGLMRLNQWGMTSTQLADWIQGCLDMGVTTFDHADIYGGYTCEGLFGEALAERPSLRNQIEIVTKCGIQLATADSPKLYDTSAAYIIAHAENSLRLFHTDHIDLLLIHRPDPLMDAAEVAGAFSQLRQAGKVLHFGVSNFMPFQFDLLESMLDFPLVTNQLEISPLHMDALHDGTLDGCQQRHIAPMAWSPLGGGRLFNGEDQQAKRVRHTLGEVGAALGGAALDQVALAWVMAHPSRPLPVLGTGKLERVRAAVEAESLQLTRSQWFAIWEASAGRRVP
ncbi:MAG: aldo/keto reductase [Anaerolineaceae bacterium]|nr:aldo/keto reductase [Anaerolineaceae bacterium]